MLAMQCNVASAGKKKGRAVPGLSFPRGGKGVVRQTAWMLLACLPFGPLVTSKETFWPSFSVRKP